ncbi:hypothetical protein QQF64_022712 [Cirrhinus molitorella]|uniref:CCHC-type domain-containing protein n=1 Tax=Cirrhinus molitorella TaxID=172907 RepID=A0ABR3L5E1_9TELE
MVENRCFVQREEVYRWFSVLSSAQRAEFLCGLLDLCVPIELRFLGSCLEDLARKDYHSLRDAEIKANNPADLANLTNITDEVVRSKLLVSLALLSSDNRVAAGVLFRTLTHIDTIINNYGLQLNDGQTGEQFLLLFTMASNHPAFSFHQKQVLRQELTQIQEILQVTVGEASSTSHAGGASAAALPNVSATSTFSSYITASTLNSCQAGCPCCKTVQREVTGGQTDEGLGPEIMPPSPSLLCQEMPLKLHVGKPSKVYVERVELRGVTPKSDKPTEYILEALWSDSTLSTVSKTPQEVVEFISQLSQLFPDECLEKLLPQMPGLDSTHELDPRCLTSLPPQVLKHDKVRFFFSSSSAPQFPTSTNLGCLLQYRGASRPICGVASIQPVLSVHAPLPQSSPAHLPPLPPQTAVAILPGTSVPMGEASPPQMHLTNPITQAQSQQPNPEQNGILDWLRKLRLHKYYPVFKQLTMEEFLALTEEDLNKYDLTQGAKKKLKTQLELQKEKLEKRYVVSQFPVSCGGVARVTPSSHIGPLAHAHSGSELRVDVENSSLPIPRDSSSSSGYSSAPSSPMTPLSRDTSFDRVKDPHRRLESGLDPGEKERPCFLLNPAVSTGPSRPTAQVLPVQNDPSLCPSQMNLPPPSLPLLSPGRILNSPRKPRPPPLCSEERPKPMGSGVTVGVRLENIFPGLNLDGSPGHQDVSGPRVPLTVLRSPPGSYPFSTPSSCPSSSSSTRPSFSPVSGVPLATASNVPMAAVPGNTYCVNSTPTVTPSSSPASTENSGYASVQANSANSSSSLCVCSSCGCSGNCGSYGALPASYAGYFPHPFSGTSVFTLGPLLHFSPLLTGSGTASPFSYPLVAPPIYNSSLSHDSQQNLVLPPVQGFLGGGGGVYQPHGMMGNGSSGHKKTGNVSCYNCGLSGHRAQDCKQPAMDSAQQGTFRLKYSPQSDSQDSGD